MQTAVRGHTCTLSLMIKAIAAIWLITTNSSPEPCLIDNSIFTIQPVWLTGTVRVNSSEQPTQPPTRTFLIDCIHVRCVIRKAFTKFHQQPRTKTDKNIWFFKLENKLLNVARFRNSGIHVFLCKQTQLLSINVVQPRLAGFGRNKSTAQSETKMQNQIIPRFRTEEIDPQMQKEIGVCVPQMCVRTMKTQTWIIIMLFWKKRIVHDRKFLLCAPGHPGPCCYPGLHGFQ